MTDTSLDQYSQPLKQEQTTLATIFWLNARDSKKGRLFIPLYDERYPLAFPVTYEYVSSFLEKDNASGNHYHHLKQEILIPLHGVFEIHLQDVKTRIKETIVLTATENKAVYIKTGIAHKVVSQQETGVLLVLASHPSTLEDEIEYSL